MGEGGIIVPPDGYFARVSELLRARDIVFIADEVQSGFGRTGRMFAIEHSGVEPDIMAVAKGIADGFPLAGFIASAEIADAFRPGEHLSTFGGSPVSCAAGLASIQVLEDDRLVERSAALGDNFRRQLHDLAARREVIGDVRGQGLMIGVELVADKYTKAPAPEWAVQVRKFCRDNGVLIGVGGFFGNVVRIQPPLMVTEAQLGFVLEVLDGALAAISEAQPDA
jgi:4-aminobutyrate aminotransferase-like enzyme